MSYQAQITPWFQIQPDVRYVFNPRGSLLNARVGRRVGDALVLDLRATITFLFQVILKRVWKWAGRVVPPFPRSKIGYRWLPIWAENDGRLLVWGDVAGKWPAADCHDRALPLGQSAKSDRPLPLMLTPSAPSGARVT